MALRPIDTNSLRDPEESDERFAHGATAMHRYDTGEINLPNKNKQPMSHKRHIVILVVAILAVVLVGLCVALVAVRFDAASTSTTVEAGTAVDVTIPSGSGDGDIATILSEAGVISSPTQFLNAVDDANANGNLKSGTYHLTTGMDNAEVVSELVQGPESISLTIAEGLTVDQTAARVEETLGIPTADFLAQAKASNYVTNYPFLAGAYNDSLEGFLFPETYSFDSTATADTVIRAMLDQYEAVTSTIDFTTATQGDTTLTEYQIIVMASLIERETAVSSERPIIASVIYNRLNAGMYLQIDAAIAYALNKTGLLTEADLQVDSPYNVYLNLGLPPGPICSPSADSIKAAAAPAVTNYYYYVASSALDGTHVFCETDEEFAAARDAYNAAMGIS